MNPSTWPLWLRSQIGGLLWGGYMYIFVASGPRTVLQAVIFLFGGVAFGLVFWAITRAQERHVFGYLTGPERLIAVQAVRTGRPPDDPNLGEVAMRVAERWAKPKMRPAHQIMFFGLFVVLSAYVGAFVTRWGWLGVAFWPLAAWFVMRTERRQQREGERYLEMQPLPRHS